MKMRAQKSKHAGESTGHILLYDRMVQMNPNKNLPFIAWFDGARHRSSEEFISVSTHVQRVRAYRFVKSNVS